MTSSACDRIAVTFSMTASEYASYAAAVDRQFRSWTPFFIFLAVLFSAVPVALMFRTLAAAHSHDVGMIELVGRSSLFAFVLGFFATLIGGSTSTRLVRQRHYRRMASRLESQTVVLEKSGITLTGPASQSTWQWQAVRGLTRYSDLMLIWTQPLRAVAIPGCSFGSEEARAAAEAFICTQLSAAKASAGPVPSANAKPS